MFRFLSFIVSLCFHGFLFLVLMFRGEPDIPSPIDPPKITEKEPVSQDEKNENSKPMSPEKEFDKQEPLQQMRYEVSLKERDASETEYGDMAASKTQQDGINGRIDQSDVDRTAVPRLVVKNLTYELTEQLIQSKYLIPLIEVRDPLLDEKNVLMIQKTGSGYRCQASSAEDRTHISHRALPAEFTVENEIRRALIQSVGIASSRQPVRLYLSNQLDQMIARRQQEAVKHLGNTAQSKTTYGRIELRGNRVDFIVDRVK